MPVLPGREPAGVIRPREPADQPEPQRKDTDDRLRTERETADKAVALRVAEGKADGVVDLARERADAVVSEARKKADVELQGAGKRRVVAQHRVDADGVLRGERAAADEDLRRERQAYAHTLLTCLDRDSTDRSLLTERARSDSDIARRDDFLGIVSHDLNNLLCGIIMSAESIAKNAAPSDQAEPVLRSANRIQLYSSRMKRLIGDLVDVTSIAAGKLAMTPTPVDPQALIREAFDTFRPFAIERGISLEAETPAPASLVACDCGRISQVLANLVANACKFTPRGGTVCIRATEVANELCFSVRDTGSGIPDHLLDAVFERFWQATSDRRGLGLGLYISKSIIEAHEGRIWVESDLGQGSTFHFTLPVAPYPTD